MTPNFWRGKRVLVTGHTGFKGSWLAFWLLEMGADVFGYALAPETKPALFNLLDLDNKMNSQIADVRDLDSLNSCFDKAKPEIVIHMAAQPLVRRSYIDPVETYSTNVMGTVNVLEAARHCDSVKVIINVTTDKCYENPETGLPFKEDSPMGGYDPYSNSKACSELVTSSYRSSFLNPEHFDQHGKSLASARAGNVIGGGDWAEDRLIPDVLMAFLNGEAATIRYPQAIRPWQHVLEPLSGYLTLAEKMWSDPIQYAQAWNFGPLEDDVQDVEFIVKFLAEKCSQLKPNWKIDAAEHLHEAKYLQLDISKAQTELSWEPRWSLENTLSNLVNWYLAWKAGDNMSEITRLQLKQYEKSEKSNEK